MAWLTRNPITPGVLQHGTGASNTRLAMSAGLKASKIARYGLRGLAPVTGRAVAEGQARGALARILCRPNAGAEQDPAMLGSIFERSSARSLPWRDCSTE